VLEGTVPGVEPQYRIDRPGGSLGVHDLSVGQGEPDGAGQDRPLVLALHGITANALSWRMVADALGDRLGPGSARVLAPDLRGRACSRDITGPWGVDAHVADVIGVADAFGAREVVLLGHSMGAFVAALTAARHPDRVRAAVLVDGGLSLPVPAETDIDAALTAVIGPAMQRLSMRFADEQAYLAFWEPHPAMTSILADPVGAATLHRYLRHDLVQDGPELVSSCILDAVRADGRDLLASAEVHAAVGTAVAAGVPVELLWAQRGLMDEPQGLYDEQRLAALGVPEQVRVTRVADVNHYSVILGPGGVEAVTAAVQRQLVSQPA